MKLRLLLPLFLALLTGCTTLSTDKKHAKDLSSVKHLYVEHRLNDNHGIDLLIVEELHKLGLDAACGPLTMMPENTDAIITYEDEWTFDFTTHMISLDVTVRSPEKDKVLGNGNYFLRWVNRPPPASIVHDVITALFKHG